ncbi:MAG: FAD-dependent thymidylate synthase [Chlamydiia bacterium]|nr:FAD-dependent thymidylate synthase [Chlamydiia bacterium]
MLTDDYEEFTENQRALLEKYVTNIHGHVFALRNLPEVIKGALFSRYSRSTLGLRSLLLKEFITPNDETAFEAIAGLRGNSNPQEQIAAIKKAQNFYDRILDGYGDDSIGELGGAHLAIENISMLAAKEVEDCRIGGSPLEKSTRYIYFDQKVKEEYLFYREPILMTSAYRDLYIDTCNHLFETYSALIPKLTQIFEEKIPHDPETSQAAYNASLRAKVLDCLRGLLPAGTLTNVGVYGNGRFFEGLIRKLQCHSLTEMEEVGKRSFDELSKIIPSFVRRAGQNHHTFQGQRNFTETQTSELSQIAFEHVHPPQQEAQPGVKLIYHEPDAPYKVAAALLFPFSEQSYEELFTYCQDLSDEEIGRILEAGASGRESRRHKSPRALEHANFTFEIVADFGIYRDLHRHRMLTQARQLLNCSWGFYTPEEIRGTDLEPPYVEALQKAKEAYDTIAHELPEEAQYVVPMAYNIRWYYQINLRALQWLTELRSSPAGHPAYRYIAQALAKEVTTTFPCFERFFRFVDFEGYDLGRLGQEEKKVATRS